MITVAVAAGDAGANRYYRELLADAKFDAIFTPAIELLIRCVKSRPVDLVIFDLAPPAVPATSWLEAVKQDGDLALTPVLWVGTAHPMALTTTLDNYRPGTRIRQRPNLKTLMALVHKIVGGTPGGQEPDSDHSIQSSKEWKPEGEIIDDALSIFADSEHKNGRGHARPLAGDADEDDFQTAEIRRPAPSKHTSSALGSSLTSAPREVLAIPSGGPEEQSVLDFSDEDPEASSESAALPETQSSAVGVASEAANPEAAPASEEFIDEITNQVISRLAVEVFRNFDTGAIRQTVREVLAEKGK